MEKTEGINYTNDKITSLIPPTETIKFKFLDNNIIEQPFSQFDGMSISQMKAFVVSPEVFAKSNVRFIYKGRVLKDEIFFEDSGIEPGSFVHCVVKEKVKDV